MSRFLIFWAWEGMSNVGSRILYPLMFGSIISPGDWFLGGRRKYMKYHTVRCLVAVSPTKSRNRDAQGQSGPFSLVPDKSLPWSIFQVQNPPPTSTSPPVLLFFSWCLHWVLCPQLPCRDPGLAWPTWEGCVGQWSAPHVCQALHCSFAPILSCDPLNNLWG